MTYDVKIYNGNCLDVMKTMPDNSVDSIVTDPPYGLKFMGKKWDYEVPSVDIWKEALRVLKPGGHLLAFSGNRTQHRMACNIEDAGFEIRDMIAWIYGSGFPKSLDVSKAIDKAAGEIRPRIAGGQGGINTILGSRKCGEAISEHAISEAAKQWAGWGTGLKPALEPITLARKPIEKNTIAKNVLEYGTGGLNIDGCRIGNGSGHPKPEYIANSKNAVYGKNMGGGAWENITGRWPANLILSDDSEVVALFPNENGKSAARFFYCAKASKQDRDEGCEGFEPVAAGGMSGRHDGSMGSITMSRNHHPTVKPTSLMQYLVRLVTPPNGTCLDPFMGSGSTGKACVLEQNFNFIGIELDDKYIQIAKRRIEFAQKLTNKPNLEEFYGTGN